MQAVSRALLRTRCSVSRFNAISQLPWTLCRSFPRAFSTSSTAPPASVNLVKLLKEVKEEAAQAAQDFGADVPHNFTLIEGPTKGEFAFKKELDGEKITITGNAMDLEESQNDDEEQPQDENAEEEDEQGEVGVPCTLEFTRGSKTLNIAATAWSRSGWSLKQIGTSATSYQAEVEHFDEQLVNAWYDYLAERGIDDEMATFVASTAYKGDHNLYQDWIGDMTGYLQAK